VRRSARPHRKSEQKETYVTSRKWTKAGLIAVGLTTAIVLAGCGGSQPASQSGGPTGELKVSGSDTMVNMSQAWAEAFMTGSPNALITVKGGGSGTGIKDLIAGTTDFANASREIKAEESDKIKAKGGEAVETKVARDGIAIIVNPANGVEKVTKEQLGKVFRGEITNWKDVGGADKAIVLVSRDTASGTYEFFKEAVVGKDKNYAKSARLLPTNQGIVDEVKSNDAAIGYVGVGYEAPGVKVVAVDGVKASVDTVLDGTYPLSRYLYMIGNGPPKGVGKAFVDWILSAEGQKIVKEQGFVPLSK
jgi:phosphate transport system substrate-binding protein